jgi:hypothetical protein
MSERLLELRAFFSTVKRHWTRRALLRAWTLGSAAAALVLLTGFVTVYLFAREGFPLVFTVAAVTAVALFAMARALWPLRVSPTDRQLARFIEERSDTDLDDVLVTAVDYAVRLVI